MLVGEEFLQQCRSRYPCCCKGSSLKTHGMVWVGKDLKHHVVQHISRSLGLPLLSSAC